MLTLATLLLLVAGWTVPGASFQSRNYGFVLLRTTSKWSATHENNDKRLQFSYL